MRFSIRELLLVTVVVALMLGWGLDRWRVGSELAKLREQNRSMHEWKVINDQHAKEFYDGLVERHGWTRTANGDLVSPPRPNPSAPTPNPPKP